MTAAGLVVSVVGDVCVARVLHDIDLTNVAGLTADIRRAVSNEVVALVVDLTGVRYVDSAGIQMFFDFARELSAARQGFGIAVEEDSPLRRLFKITHLHEVAAISATVASCVDAVRGQPDSRY